ncbi:hypothetical protein IMSAGC009_00341 [Lachnospiraceae bacterium]|nr:hypothetical protein IMSAGC009_00341 [Lachnospiraceae bacterium]
MLLVSHKLWHTSVREQLLNALAGNETGITVRSGLIKSKMTWLKRWQGYGVVESRILVHLFYYNKLLPEAVAVFVTIRLPAKWGSVCYARKIIWKSNIMT